jgi:NAD(P)-dependent dehydrogenase (short-subunit alcohol dehydrogenase family)
VAAAEVKNISKAYGGVSVLAMTRYTHLTTPYATRDGFDIQMQINHLSRFLLTKFLLESLKDAADRYGEARIVTLSSSGRHYLPFEGRSYVTSTTSGFTEEYFLKSKLGTLGGAEGDTQMPDMYRQTQAATAGFAMALARKFAQSERYSKINAMSCAIGNPVKFSLLARRPIPLWWLPFQLISEADASSPLLAAMFSQDANSGDFYEAKHQCGSYGWPKKRIQSGKPMSHHTFRVGGSICPESGNELACSKVSQDFMWAASEKGLGEVFNIE